MLVATPRGIFNWNFVVSRNGAFVGEIEVARIRERGEIRIGNETYSVERTSLLEGTFVLRQGDRMLASAKKLSLRRHLELAVDGRVLQIKGVLFKRVHRVLEQDRVIGCVAPARLFRREARIDLPNSLSLPVQFFVLWLVLIMWRRDAHAHTPAAPAG